MTLSEKLSQIRRTSLLPPLKSGKSDDLEQLWKDIIEPLLPDETAVRQWHKVLTDYVNKSESVLFIRAYGSHSTKESSDVLRRGFYNTTNHGFSAFYGDNSFPWLFYSMSYDGFAPKDTDEFENLMKSRRFPCGCIQTTAENRYAAFSRGQNPGITTKGYKLAHIYSAGENYNTHAGYSKISELCKDLFPRGTNTEWSKTKTDVYGTYHYRKIDIDSKLNATKARSFLVAHFIRSVHPLNYFVVPKENSIEWIDSFGDKRHEIGEYPELIRYVGYKIREKYSKGNNIYDEFLNLIYPTEIHNVIPENKIIKAKYKLDGWKKKASASAAKTPTSRAAHSPALEFIPSKKNLFKSELMKAKKALILYEHTDGKVVKESWIANNITPSSNIKANIRSRPYYRKNKSTLYKITVII